MKTFLFLVSFAKYRNNRYPKCLRFTKPEMRELVSTYLMLILKHNKQR